MASGIRELLRKTSLKRCCSIMTYMIRQCQPCESSGANFQGSEDGKWRNAGSEVLYEFWRIENMGKEANSCMHREGGYHGVENLNKSMNHSIGGQ